MFLLKSDHSLQTGSELVYLNRSQLISRLEWWQTNSGKVPDKYIVICATNDKGNRLLRIKYRKLGLRFIKIVKELDPLISAVSQCSRCGCKGGKGRVTDEPIPKFICLKCVATSDKLKELVFHDYG